MGGGLGEGVVKLRVQVAIRWEFCREMPLVKRACGEVELFG